ncbi:MAG: hypothetical protein M1818_005995 [Claussenomyces sp. TS43310]|nr:MAG: hypothetical protein M1818_005995 [Claussenomyces sp. TS43310]
MESGKPTLHHLSDSQSQRILWLLEELGIPYNLKLYARIDSGKDRSRAPPELTAAHPLGKSPVLVTSDGRTIPESSAIAAYLLKTYDPAGRFQGDDWIRDEVLTSFAGSTLSGIIGIQLMLDMMGGGTPILLRPLVRVMTGGIDRAFVTPELRKNMQCLETELGDRDFFMGKEPGRADFMLSWPFDLIEQRKWFDFAAYPKLQAWRTRCQDRPAWKSGLEKGNGYNLARF